MGIGAALSAGASLIGGVMSSNASSKAADAQVGYAEDALDLQREMYDTSMDMLSPFYGAGLAGLEPYMNTLGLYKADPGLTIEYINDGSGGGGGTNAFYEAEKERLYNASADNEGNRMLTGKDQKYLDGIQGDGGSGSGGYYKVGDSTFGSYDEAAAYLNGQASWENRGFQETPGYQYNVDQMQRSVDRSASAGGRSLSGETLRELQYNAKGLANQEYGNYQNALAGLVGMGTGTVSQMTGAGQNYANAASNLYTNMGQARASGYEGQASAWNNALGNMTTAYMYDKMGMFG